jgi:hypothetical protein
MESTKAPFWCFRKRKPDHVPLILMHCLISRGGSGLRSRRVITSRSPPIKTSCTHGLHFSSKCSELSQRVIARKLLRRSNPASFAMTERRHTFVSSRRISSELCIASHTLLRQRAQGRPGAGRAPTVHCAKGGDKNLHSGIQVKPSIRPSLRSGFTAYAELSPGSDALLPPSPCGWLMCVPGRTAHITTRLDAQTPGVRTTRFCRTPTAPVVCARLSLTVARPAIPFAPVLLASTTAHPAFVTIAIRPSDRDEVATIYCKSEFR